MTVKRCARCGVEKPLEEFARNRRARDGRVSRCRACHAEYYRANREAILEQQREYWNANREAIREQRRAHREANREAILERLREYHRARRARVAVEGPRRYAAREPYPADRLTEVTYNGAHNRVRNWYGPARLHPCAASGCDRQADQWAYVGTPDSDPHRRTETKTDARDGTTREVSYSLNPARYAPLCHGCHVRLDRDAVDVFAADGALFSLTLTA